MFQGVAWVQADGAPIIQIPFVWVHVVDDVRCRRHRFIPGSVQSTKKSIRWIVNVAGRPSPFVPNATSVGTVTSNESYNEVYAQGLYGTGSSGSTA